MGEKTGIKLLEQFGSIDNMLAHTDEISAQKLRNKVEENAQLALMSKRLATINVNVPIDIDIEKFRLREPDYDKLIEIYTKLEFNSFLKKLKITPQKNVQMFKSAEVEKTIIETADQIDKLSELSKSERVYIKTFGSLSHIERPFIEGVFLMGEEKAYLVDMVSVDCRILTEKLNRLKLNFIGHEIKNDIYALMCYGLTD